MNNEFKNILSNIEISDDMKRSIYSDCIKQKRTKDFTFRYSGLLSVLIGLVIFGTLSIGAAAAVISVKQRMEEMPEEEYEDYAYEVENDTFITTDEGYSRELTDSEIARIIKLERDYYDNGVFPKEAMAHLETKDELKDGQMAYVAEDNLIYLPDGEMSDEQLLQYIDHDTKKWYVNAQALEEEGFDTGINSQLSYESTPITPGSTEETVRQKAEAYLMEYLGVDISADPTWIVIVDHFEADPEIDMDATYMVDVSKKSTGYATGYQIELKASDLSLLMLNTYGYQFELEAKRYSFDEADAMEADVVESAKAMLHEIFGADEPDSYEYDNESDYSYGAAGTGYVSVFFRYGDDTYFTRIRLEDKKVISFYKR